MKIEDISGMKVTVSAHTITVKDDMDKTRGMVRNIDNLYSLSAKEQMEYSERLKKASLTRDDYMGQLRNILVCDGSLYYLCDDYMYDMSLSMESGYHKVIDKFEPSGVIKVIHCRRILK